MIGSETPSASAQWLEISLTVNGELAEAVAEVLARYASNGIVTEQDITYNDTEEDGRVSGPVRVYGYLLLDEHLEDKRRRLEEALWHLGQIEPLPQPEFRTIEDQNWMESWKDHYHPIPIGKHLLILPAWLKYKNTDRQIVRIDPSMAFGTGTHPSTQLCMQMIERYVLPGKPVIDVGCGSGILSIAALKLGANHALAVDTDSAAIVGTRQNAAANQVSEHLEVAPGSVEEIRQGNFSINNSPLVLVNILAPIIVRLLETGLADLVSQDGVLVLAGILDRQAPDIQLAAEQCHLQLLDRLQVEDWVALAFRPAPPQ